MTIGRSIALIIIGAILRYAVTWTPNGIDLQVVGLILIIGGVVGLIISLAFLLARRRRASSTQVYESACSASRLRVWSRCRSDIQVALRNSTATR